MNAMSNTAPPKPPASNTEANPTPKSGVANSNAANEAATKGRPAGDRDNGAEVRRMAEVEGEIRDFVRRDVTLREKTRPALSPSSTAAEHMNTVIQRVAGASTYERVPAARRINALVKRRVPTYIKSSHPSV